MTKDALDGILNDMKLNLTPEEIPAALESLIDDKHQRELEDLLLKHYEQKCIELKEETLAMMEEKQAKQIDARKAAKDRKAGLEALATREDDPGKKQNYQNKIVDVDKQLEKELGDLDDEYIKQENKIQRQIQQRTQDREVRSIEKLQNQQLEEKNEIFEKYLPNTLLGEMI